MRVRSYCPECRYAIDAPLVDGRLERSCSVCDHADVLEPPATAVVDGRVESCPVCRKGNFYLKRDFPRKIGLILVAVAVLTSWHTRGLSLLAAVLLDGVIYYFRPEIAVCYHCQAEFFDFAKNPRHGAFDARKALTIEQKQHERERRANA